MESASTRPIASLERLIELGLDPKQFGSCSEPQGQRGYRNQIEHPTNAGCKYRGECKWAKVPMPEKSKNGEMVMRPRPRYVKTRLIKPKRDGSGKDAIREGYCTCAQWHSDLKRRHGKNNEIAEVVGGEGDTVLLMGSKLITKDEAGNAIQPQYKPTFFKKVIPAFLDPEDDPELIVDVYAGTVRKAEDDKQEEERNEDRDRRMKVQKMGGEPKAEDMGEGSRVDDLKEAIREGSQSGA